MGNQESPLVSVIMPAYNSEKFIEQAIESVFGQKGGFLTELIVINDGSSDHTKEVVEEVWNKHVDDGGLYPDNCWV